MGNFPLFYITDGTNKVDFFSKKSPFHLIDWTPVTAKLKDDGVWQSPMFQDGRRPISVARENISDVFTIAVSGGSMDDAIDNMRKLRLLLEKAVYYWTSEWQREPVYLVARGDCETNTRYAIIKNYSLPTDDSPFEPPLGGGSALKAMGNLILGIEHGLWQHVIPGTSEQVPIKGHDCWDYPYCLGFPLSTSIVNCGSDASLDDLHAAAFTAEAWVYATAATSFGTILGKPSGAAVGWFLAYGSIFGFQAYVYCAVTDAYTYVGLTNSPRDQWVHVAMTWDNAADRIIRMFINGNPFGTVVPGSGAISSDAANNLNIGNDSGVTHSFYGYIGWARISNYVRYSGVFQPPPRCIIPQVDAGTLGLWIHEGQGTAIDNIEGTAARDGTATNCTWHSDCCEDES